MSTNKANERARTVFIVTDDEAMAPISPVAVSGQMDTAVAAAMAASAAAIITITPVFLARETRAGIWSEPRKSSVARTQRTHNNVLESNASDLFRRSMPVLGHHIPDATRQNS